MDFARIVLCTTSFSCLFVCEQVISKSCVWIWMKCGGHVGCVTRKNCFNFGEDPNLDPDTIIFLILIRDFSPLRNVAKNDISHLKKLWTSSDKTLWMIWSDDNNKSI